MYTLLMWGSLDPEGGHLTLDWSDLRVNALHIQKESKEHYRNVTVTERTTKRFYVTEAIL